MAENIEIHNKTSSIIRSTENLLLLIDIAKDVEACLRTLRLILVVVINRSKNYLKA